MSMKRGGGGQQRGGRGLEREVETGESRWGWGGTKKTISAMRIKKKKKTYSIKNHVYFEKDDPFCWPCQLLAFQGVGFAFSILDLWERDMTGVCLAIPG